MRALSRYLSAFVVAMGVLLIGATPALANGGGGDSGSGAASGFTVLSAGAAVTCSDSTVSGDVGALGTVTQTLCPVDGTVVTPIATGAGGAAADFDATHTALGNVACDQPVNTTLADATLEPGVYCFDSFVALTATTLTLDGPADSVWVFKIGTPGGAQYLEATDLSIEMAGGGQSCNVSWFVADYATMTDSSIRGSVLAGAAITSTGTAGAPSVVNGNLLTRADVTLSDTDVTGCAGIAETGWPRRQGPR